MASLTPVNDRSIWISTTSPSMISDSSLIRTPIDRRNAWVNASVFDISSEKISDAASIVNGTSEPRPKKVVMMIGEADPRCYRIHCRHTLSHAYMHNEDIYPLLIIYYDSDKRKTYP